MSLIKNEIPILEFDTDTSAVIMPNRGKLGVKLPEKAVYAFLGEHVDEYARKNNARSVGTFPPITKEYPIYVTEYNGEEICLVQAPVGAAASTQILDWLIGYGTRKIITGGCCGVLENYPEGMFLVPYKALRDEGTSYHYAPPSRFMEVNCKALKAIEQTLTEHGLNYRKVITWSTDGFYRETKEKVAYRKSEGCSVVEMECAALAACAKMRDVIWGEILFTADSLADMENYDERNWGRNAFEYALTLCLDAVVRL